MYKKELTVRTDPSLFKDTRYGLMDITWLNLRPFLEFVDGVGEPLPVADSPEMQFSEAEKIYHLYLVRRLYTMDSNKQESYKDEVIRVVLTGNGVAKMQPLNV